MKQKLKDLPVQALLGGEYFRIHRLHKDLNNLSIVPHRHDHYELIIVTEGEGRHYINFKQFTILPGRVFFLHPGQVHLFEDFEREGWLVLFGEEMFKRFLAIHPAEAESGMLDLYSLNPFIDLDTVLKGQFNFIIQQLQEELSAGQQSVEILLHFVSVLLLQANRLHKVQHPSKLISASRQTGLLKSLKNRVEDKFRTEHTAAFYAKNLATDIKLLNKICRQATGLSVYELLQERLITESKILLQTTTMSVKEISYSLGFNDPAFFGRFFKRHTWMTPAEFRRTWII